MPNHRNIIGKNYNYYGHLLLCGDKLEFSAVLGMCTAPTEIIYLSMSVIHCGHVAVENLTF